MKIVGLGHYSRTGKDTFANYLVDSLREYDPKLRVKKIPFAWKLKQICFELYAWAGMREPEFYDTKEGEPYRDVILPAIGLTPVKIWINMGTPAVREQVYDKTWIDYLLKNELNLDVLIIPDVRFPNEADAILETGGSLHKVVRPGYGPRKSVADRAMLGWDGWGYIWGGSGLLSELQSRANQTARWITGSPAPKQCADERAYAKSVENVEPWEPTGTEGQYKETINFALARGVVSTYAVAYGVGGGPNGVGAHEADDFVNRLADRFPKLREEFGHILGKAA